MATMKVQNYKKYNNEYIPSWVKPTKDEWEREENYIRKLVGETKESKKKKADQGKKKISTHKGKKSSKKFYAIKIGRKKNIIVNSWEECSKLVLGYPGAIYKGFNDKEEAKKFL